MRVTCTRVFGAAFLVTWIGIVWLGDFNTYVTSADGRQFLLDEGGAWGVIIGCIVAALVALWAALAFWIGRLFWITLRRRTARQHF